LVLLHVVPCKKLTKKIIFAHYPPTALFATMQNSGQEFVVVLFNIRDTCTATQRDEKYEKVLKEEIEGLDISGGGSWLNSQNICTSINIEITLEQNTGTQMKISQIKQVLQRISGAPVKSQVVGYFNENDEEEEEVDENNPNNHMSLISQTLATQLENNYDDKEERITNH
jgi:hypothetical protein